MSIIQLISGTHYYNLEETILVAGLSLFFTVISSIFHCCHRPFEIRFLPMQKQIHYLYMIVNVFSYHQTERSMTAHIIC